VRLPDNVWRPLVIGHVKEPKGIAVDSSRSRLFVADPPAGRIYWYGLNQNSNGLLDTDDKTHVAVEGYKADWLAVSSIGDLFFTGTDLNWGHSGIFKQEVTKLNRDNPFFPTRMYSRADSGYPQAGAWRPSGLAIGSFNLYWGNSGDGRSHGAVVRASRKDTGMQAAERTLSRISSALEEVRGVCITGTSIFYVSTAGVFGHLLGADVEVTSKDDSVGLISVGPRFHGNLSWEPQSITWDGDGDLYLTDSAAGGLYRFPATTTRPQPLTKFADAPHVHGLSMLRYHSSGAEGLQFLCMTLLIAATLGSAMGAG